jgi:hypothetical protein
VLAGCADAGAKFSPEKPADKSAMESGIRTENTRP